MLIINEINLLYLITPTKPNLNATVNSFRKAHAL